MAAVYLYTQGTATTAAAAAAVGLDASDLELALTSVVAAGPAVGGEPQHCLVCVARRIPTKSKRFVHVDTHETDFVMSTHSIIVDDEEDNRMMLMAPDTLKDGQRHHQSVAAAAGSDGSSVSQQGGNPVLASVVRHEHPAFGQHPGRHSPPQVERFDLLPGHATRRLGRAQLRDGELS